MTCQPAMRWGYMAECQCTECNSQVSLLSFRNSGASIRADEVQVLQEGSQLSIHSRVCGVVLQSFPCGLHIVL